eukprot:s505_g13.t1
MAGERLAPWRKTGQRADGRHFEGLAISCIFEFAAYDDHNRQQGRVLACLTGSALETNLQGGRVFEGQVLAVEDGYYEYWFEDLYGKIQDAPVVFFHFCDVPVGVCHSETAFRHPIHVDVFRLVSSSQAERLSWLSEAQKGFIRSHPGVEGLAHALGAGHGAPKREAEARSRSPGKREKKDKNRDRDDRRHRKRSSSAAPQKNRDRKSRKPHQEEKGERAQRILRDELAKKTPPEPRLSALDLTAAHRKKKKTDKKKKKGRSKSSSSGQPRGRSPSTSSSSGELFHSAALPKGMERLRRLHQKEPGTLASMSLLRMQELVGASSSRKGNGCGQSRKASSSSHVVPGRSLPAAEPVRKRRSAKPEGDEDGGDSHRHALPQRSVESVGCDDSALQGARAGAQAAELVPSVTAGTSAGRRPVSSVQAGVEGGSNRSKRRLEDPERSLQASEAAVDLDTDLGTHERGNRRERRDRDEGHSTKQPTKRRRQERERQGQERPVWSKVTLKDGHLELPALERALMNPNVSDHIRASFKSLLQDPKLHRLYGGILGCYESLDDKHHVYKDFTSLMVEWCNYPPNIILDLLESYYAPLAREGGPTGDAGFHRVMPGLPAEHPGRRPGRYQRAQEGKLLGVVGTSQVREIFSTWDAVDGGVYVGDGSEYFPTSIFREAYADNIALEDAAQVLDGRTLYVDPGGFSVAAGVVEKFSVTGKKQVWTWEDCQAFMRQHLDGDVSVSFVGVVLKLALRRCPGHLGNIIRMMPACARRQFRQTPVELLPICLPEDTQVELRLHRLLLSNDHPRALTENEKVQALELARECGADAWLGLVLAVLNAMFCGGSRPLGKVLPHPKTRTPEQIKVLEHIQGMVKLWINEDQHMVKVTNWEVQSQELGDFYTGYEVTKAYKLSWAAISPHVPGPGEAGRVSLAETVPPELQDFVLNPDLLRIPDDELGDVKYSAPVLVESDAEYDLIVRHLVKAGMFEREVEEETVKVNDTPIYNGLFGVHKGWIDEGGGNWRRSLRLIVNLIPTNLLQRRMPEQASKSMGYAPLWGNMVLLDNEVILAYGEDIKHCFHIFSPGPRWRGDFVLSKEASGSSFDDGIQAKARPRVRSAPMGWANIVDFVQSSLERMGTLGGIPATRCVKMGEPSPLLELSTPRQYHSFYVDNYDGFVIIAATDLAEYQGRPSDSQLELRRTFQAWNIGRDEKKAAEGRLQWVSLGAEQLGAEGLVGSSRKFRRSVMSASLNLLLKPDLRTSDLEMLSVVGKHMHATQFCRPLACCFDELYRNLNMDDPEMLLDMQGREELMMVTILLPMLWSSQRTCLSPTVYATDASPGGGGACQTTGLSARGRAKLHLACSEHAGVEGGACDSVVLIEVFGGIGGLRKAIELLGMLPQGIILIDSDPLCLKLAKCHCAFVLVVDNVYKVDKAMVRSWRLQFPRATRVVMGGGWPCINHSSLNSRRLGAEADSSKLLDVMVDIAENLKEVSRPLRLPDWDVVEVSENVTMDQDDLTTQSRKIGCLPIMCEAADALRCRRPRLFWLKNLELVKAADLQLLEDQQVGGLEAKLQVAKIDTERPPLEWFLRRGCTKLIDDGRPFFTFARPLARSSPPSEPAGYDRCDSKTLGRWRGDAYRLAPYQYSEDNLVKTPQGPRRLLSDEQLRMLGYNSDALDIKQKLSEDQRGQLIGNTFPVLVVARLLAGLCCRPEDCEGLDLTAELWKVWKSNEDRVQQLKEASWSVRFGPGVGELFQAKVGDFVLGAKSGTWSLPLSKSGQRQGVTESEGMHTGLHENLAYFCAKCSMKSVYETLPLVWVSNQDLVQNGVPGDGGVATEFCGISEHKGWAAGGETVGSQSSVLWLGSDACPREDEGAEIEGKQDPDVLQSDPRCHGHPVGATISLRRCRGHWRIGCCHQPVSERRLVCQLKLPYHQDFKGTDATIEGLEGLDLHVVAAGGCAQ